MKRKLERLLRGDTIQSEIGAYICRIGDTVDLGATDVFSRRLIWLGEENEGDSWGI